MNGSVGDKGALHPPATAATTALRPMVYASLFAALMAAGAYMAIPIGPVPIVLQNMFVFLSGLLLGSRWGLASVAVYLLAGIVGLPVFAGGTGGIGRIFGPTGGFLLGYLPVVFLVGRMAERLPRRMVWDVAAMTAGAHGALCLRGGVACSGDRPARPQKRWRWEWPRFSRGMPSRSPPPP